MKADPFRDWLNERRGERYGVETLAKALGCTPQTIYGWLGGRGVSLALAPHVIEHAQRRDSVSLTSRDLLPVPALSSRRGAKP